MKMNQLRAPLRDFLLLTLGHRVVTSVQTGFDQLIAKPYYSVEPAGRHSSERLREKRNAFSGKRCFIIGNGPSLKLMDLSPLQDEYTFGLNRIYLMFEELGFSTSFLVCVNPYVLEQCSDEIATQPADTYVTWQHRGFLPKNTDATFLRCVHQPGFYGNPVDDGLWQGATVTYVAMQLAYYFGFEEVILIGVDHSFTSKGKPGKLIESKGDDPNHFSGAYFGKGFKWQLPDLEMSEVAYRMARDHFERAGRRIYDATVGGQLDVFPKRDFDSFFVKDSSHLARTA